MDLKALTNSLRPTNWSIQQYTSWISKKDGTLTRTAKIVLLVLATITLCALSVVVKAMKNRAVEKKKSTDIPPHSPPAQRHTQSKEETENRSSIQLEPFSSSSAFSNPSDSRYDLDASVEATVDLANPFKRKKSAIDEEFLKLEMATSLSESDQEQHFKVAELHSMSCRCVNVYANESTRFKIAEDAEIYFNANWVLNKQAIAAMSPLESELGKFWMMLWNSQVTAIVMLTNLKEGRFDKCFPYWPDLASEATYTFSTSEFKVHNVFEQELPFKNHEGDEKFLARAFKVNHRGAEKLIIQYHLLNWTDREAVSKKVLAQSVKIVHRHIDEKGGPILVHCKAGTGRTGTFLAAFEAYNRLLQGNQNPDLISEIAYHLRGLETGRHGLIGTETQYQLLYDTVDQLSEELKALRLESKAEPESDK